MTKIFDQPGWRSGSTFWVNGGEVTPPPPPPPPPTGLVSIPFGPVDNFNLSSGPPQAPGFTGSLNYTYPGGIISLLTNIHNRGQRCVLKTTAESHDDPDGTDLYRTDGEFDIVKWKAQMSLYNTTPIKNAVAAAIANGTLLGHSVMDEPTHPTWGPVGHMTKAVIDEMVRHSKSLGGGWADVATGVLCDGDWRFDGDEGVDEHYEDADFIINQTWHTDFTAGPTAFVTQTLDLQAAERLASADGKCVAVCNSINLYAGRTTGGCTLAPSGGHCLITPADLEDWGLELGRAGCGLLMWKYHSSIWARPLHVAAMASVSADLAAQPQKTWYRS